MKKVSIDVWIQLIGMLGVLGGLVFVGLEMRQSQMIAIGDSVRTDIIGANNFGINSIFVESGIHKNDIEETADIKKFFSSYLSQVAEQINIIESLKL